MAEDQATLLARIDERTRQNTEAIEVLSGRQQKTTDAVQEIKVSLATIELRVGKKVEEHFASLDLHFVTQSEFSNINKITASIAGILVGMVGFIIIQHLELLKILQR